MPRLRNVRSGVVVNVDDVTAASLDGAEWVDPDLAVTRADSQAPAGGAPRGNGTREEWAAYADSLGVEYGPEAKREDIKAAIAAADDEGDGGEGDGDDDPAGDAGADADADTSE